MSQLSKYLMNQSLTRLNEKNEVDGIVLHFEDGSITLTVYNPLSVQKSSKSIACEDLKTYAPIRINNTLESDTKAVLFFDRGISIHIDLRATSNIGPEAMVLRIGSEGFVVW